MTVPEKLRITKAIHDTLKDGSDCTIFPFNSLDETPDVLVKKVMSILNYEIDKGDTYPYDEQLDYESFTSYYFSHFVAIMFEGNFDKFSDIPSDKYEELFLGCYYVKPNYVGRSSHNCNGGFLVDSTKKGKSIGKTLGKSYLINAPKLGFKYSVFNLVYETNVASCKIWDKLGFERIGRVKNGGNLKGHGYVDAIIFGKEL